MSLCKGEGPRYPILKTFCDFLTKKYDFQLIVFSFPAPQVPSPPTKVSQNLIYFSGDPTRFDMKMTVQTIPPPTHTNFSGTSRRARELKFGTDTH